MTTLTESELLSEKDFKEALQQDLLMLLRHGWWKAKLDAGVRTLRYEDGRDLLLFFQTQAGSRNYIEVVTSGFVVKLSDGYFLDRFNKVYNADMAVQEAEYAARTQEVVMASVKKLVSRLEPM